MFIFFKMSPVFIHLIIFVTLISLGWSYLYSSTEKIQQFVDLEGQFVRGLEHYIEYESERLFAINKSEGYEDEVPIVEKRIEHLKSFYKGANRNYTSRSPEQRKNISNHPISIYRFLRNFVINWQPKLKNQTFYGYKFASFLNESKSMMPDEPDLTASIFALLRLQTVYNLSTGDVTSGNISGFQAEPLTIDERLDIGSLALFNGYPRLGADWLKTVVDECDKDTNQSSISVPRAYSNLGLAVYQLGDKEKGEELLLKAHELDNSDAVIYKLYMQCRAQNLPELRDLSLTRPVWWKPFIKLCKSNSTKVNKVKWYHRCRVRCSSIPLYRFREEILNISPYISIFHDVIGNETIKELINEVSHRLVKNYHRLPGPDPFQPWMNEIGTIGDNSPLGARISSIVAEMTSLKVIFNPKEHWYSNSERLRVVNYGICGQDDPHIDMLQVFEAGHRMARSGDRLASMVFFLSDVTVGGATAFTELQIVVPPKKGSALFWYNYTPRGEPDLRTQNAACPVAVGQKWVAQKWIWRYGNELQRPCPSNYKGAQLSIDKAVKNYLHSGCRHF